MTATRVDADFVASPNGPSNEFDARLVGRGLGRLLGAVDVNHSVRGRDGAAGPLLWHAAVLLAQRRADVDANSAEAGGDPFAGGELLAACSATLRAGADVNATGRGRDGRQSTALFVAVTAVVKGCPEGLPLIKMLLQAGADPNITGSFPDGAHVAPLFVVCVAIAESRLPESFDWPELVRVLVEGGADVDAVSQARDGLGGKPLLVAAHAAANGNREGLALAELLLRFGADPNCVSADPEGEGGDATPLALATRATSAPHAPVHARALGMTLARRLLACGASADAPGLSSDGSSGCMLFMAALSVVEGPSITAALGVVKLLLDSGAQVDAVGQASDGSQGTALFIAALGVVEGGVECGIDLIRMLLEGGADLNSPATNREGEECTPLSVLTEAAASDFTLELPKLLEEWQPSGAGADSRARPPPLPGVAFAYAELAAATRGFAAACLLGRGAFGEVYRGRLRDGREVAVKTMRCDGACRMDAEQFVQEVHFLRHYQHRNLLQVMGSSVDGPLLCLVYDYMEGGSLEARLNLSNPCRAVNSATDRDSGGGRGHRQGTAGCEAAPGRHGACHSGGGGMSWSQRMVVALDVARGIEFLHRPQPPYNLALVHRDVKPANVLLDKSGRAKLGDFGLARRLPVPQPGGPSHVDTTEVVGTLGYMPEEYVNGGELTDRVDVYSFGVLLAQLVTGQGVFVVNRLKDCAEDGKVACIVDWAAGDWPPECLQGLCQLVAGCTEQRRRHRPSMREVVPKLEAMCLRFGCGQDVDAGMGVAGEGGDEPFDAFVCPITQEVMEAPVMAADGMSYEHWAILRWLHDKDTSPRTGAVLSSKHLIPNHQLRSAIEEWRDARDARR